MRELRDNSVENNLNTSGNRRGMSPNSRKNLEKRNLKGNNHAKRDYSITRIVKELIDRPAEQRWLEVPDKDRGLSWREAIALRMLRDAVCGKYGELLERLEGKVSQQVQAELTGEVQQTFNFILPNGTKVKAAELINVNADNNKGH